MEYDKLIAQYSKYEWIELDIVKNKEDSRPESYRPVSHDTEINIVAKTKGQDSL